MCEALPFYPTRVKDVDWVELSGDDFKAEIVTDSIQSFKYMLRVEQMDYNCWWFAVYVNDQQVWDGSEISEKAAKKAALRELNKYRKRD